MSSCASQPRQRRDRSPSWPPTTRPRVAVKAAAARAAQPAWAARPLQERRGLPGPVSRRRGARARIAGGDADARDRQADPDVAQRTQWPAGRGSTSSSAWSSRSTAHRDGVRRGRHGRADRARAAGRGGQHLGLELPLVRRLQRDRAGAADRQRRAVQALGIRHARRACDIARLLHQAGVPRRCVRHADRRRRRSGQALLAQEIDGCSSPARTPPGREIAQAVGSRLIKLQLELGGKDPTYVCDDADPQGGGRVAGRRRHVQHRAKLLLGRAHLRARQDPRCLRGRVRRDGEGLQGRRPDERGHLHRTADARARSSRCWTRRSRMPKPRARRCTSAGTGCRGRATGTHPRCSATRITAWR